MCDRKRMAVEAARVALYSVGAVVGVVLVMATIVAPKPITGPGRWVRRWR